MKGAWILGAVALMLLAASAAPADQVTDALAAASAAYGTQNYKEASTQTQTVIVDDITPPVADVDPLPNATGECSVTVSTAPTATDNCVGSVTGTTTDPLTYTAQGTYTIT